MEKFGSAWYRNFSGIAAAITATDKAGREMGLDPGIQASVQMVLAAGQAGKKIMFIGNGGSAAIASHMAIDCWKNGGIRAVAFNDAPLLTCIGNDYGYASVFEKPIGMFAEHGDVLVAISSSGRSENILNGVREARSRGCGIITLSGFSPDNPLSLTGDFNFHVRSNVYGLVEVLHHSLCHCMLDNILLTQGKIKREDVLGPKSS